jgi:excisionase family DNA binding protein
MNVANEFHPIYLSIKDTARYTGLSEYYLRTKLREGKIHHITSGTKALINLPLLLAELEKQSTCTVQHNILQ